MKWITLILTATLVIPFVTIAQRAIPPGPARAMAARAGGLARGPGGALVLTPPEAPGESDQALKFVQENYPNRYGLYESLPPNGPRHSNQLLRMIQFYRNITRLQQNNPEGYQARLKQTQLQDKALGYARDHSEAKLEETARAIVDQSLSERQERIANLKARIEEQEKLLADDQKNRDQLVQQQLQIARNQAQAMSRFPGRAGEPTQVAPLTEPSSR